MKIISCKRDAQDVAELSDTVGFVDAGFGDIYRGRATHADRKLGDERVEESP